MPNFDYALRSSQKRNPSYQNVAAAEEALRGYLFLDKIKENQLGDIIKNIDAGLNYSPDERALIYASKEMNQDTDFPELTIENVLKGAPTMEGKKYIQAMLAPKMYKAAGADMGEPLPAAPDRMATIGQLLKMYGGL